MYYSKERYLMESPIIQLIALNVGINLYVREVVILLHHAYAL